MNTKTFTLILLLSTVVSLTIGYNLSEFSTSESENNKIQTRDESSTTSSEVDFQESPTETTISWPFADLPMDTYCIHTSGLTLDDIFELTGYSRAPFDDDNYVGLDVMESAIHTRYENLGAPSKICYLGSNRAVLEYSLADDAEPLNQIITNVIDPKMKPTVRMVLSGFFDLSDKTLEADIAIGKHTGGSCSVRDAVFLGGDEVLLECQTGGSDFTSEEMAYSWNRQTDTLVPMRRCGGVTENDSGETPTYNGGCEVDLLSTIRNLNNTPIPQ